MKVTLIILMSALLPLMAYAGVSLNWSFTPQKVQVNNMNTSSFDPFAPDTQPVLTNLTITNSGNPTMIDLKVQVLWNGRYLIGSVFQSLDSLRTGMPWTLTNRDLITNYSSNHFEQKPNIPSISVEAAIKANSQFGDAIMAGYFPDGDLQLKVWVREFSDATWDPAIDDGGAQLFTISIRNAGFITLLSPGAQIGQTPPKVSNAPLSFLWNNLETGMDINKSVLTIKEFAPENPPTQANVELTGTLFYQTPAGVSQLSGFSDYLPFSDSYYYAWRVSKNLANEFNPYLPRNDANPGNMLSSNWFVFQYKSDSHDTADISEFQARLNRLNNNTLLNLYSQGFVPVGVIIFEGRTYSGQDALNLIDGLFGQDIQVDMRD